MKLLSITQTKMNQSFLYLALVAGIFMNNPLSVSAQCINNFDPAGRRCGGTIQTGVPFLRIAPDARSGAMGDVGLATSADAHSVHFNASKTVFAPQKTAVAVTYTPWLRQLGLDDIYLAYLSGYTQIGKAGKDEPKQSVGGSLRFFSLGEIAWTDENAMPLGLGRPREFEISAFYARQLNENLAVSLSGKYIYSNLASGQIVAGSSEAIKAGQAAAADISLTYRTPIDMNGKKTNLQVATAITNLGNKISYVRESDFLPTNLGLGAAWEIPVDEFNSFTFALDLNKLLVPTPDSAGEWRKVSPIAGVLRSFNDAPGGGREELQELTYSVGAEYWYDKQFAVRAGYFNENKSKGGRQYFTAGVGLKYNVLGLNLSYLVPTTSQRSPLDNTLRFSLYFDPASFRDDESVPSED